MDQSGELDEAMHEQSQPTPYADVNAVLHDFLARIHSIMGHQFVGMYLTGSLAIGDFASHRSDIDFVVVSDVEVSGDQLSALQVMHARFNASDSPWATEVEAVYFSREEMRRHDPARSCHPHIERGADEILHMDQLDVDWIIQRSILREYGVVVAGPPIRTLIDPIDRQEMRRAAVALMEVWWGPMSHDPARLERYGYQAYAVLTMCRMLYTLETGMVVSKPVAARWAQGILDARWSGLIERALDWRKDRQSTLDGDVQGTQNLIQYVLQRCQGWRMSQGPATT